MKTFISFSGGVESTAMCILYGANATAIWCDTGAEHEEMYKRIDYVEQRIKAIHPTFKLIRLKPSVTVLNKKCETLTDAVLIKHFLPSAQSRYCTEKFKIAPIDNFLKQQGKCELFIGLNADETNRTGNYLKAKNVTYRYPLIEDGFTRSDCEAVLLDKDLHPNFPVYMQRGGCWMCFYKTRKEYKALAILNPPEFQRCIEFESAYQDRREKFYSILSTGESMQQIQDEVNREIEIWGIEEVKNMYSKTPAHKTCGPFCHR